MKTVRRIIKIHAVKNFEISCLFNNGESRIIDFQELFRKWEVREDDREYPLMTSKEEFQKVRLVDGTLTWPNILIPGQDDEGNSVQYNYDLDPIVLS